MIKLTNVLERQHKLMFEFMVSSWRLRPQIPALPGISFANLNNLYLIYLSLLGFLTVQFSSVAQSCPTLSDPMDSTTPGFPVHH